MMVVAPRCPLAVPSVEPLQPVVAATAVGNDRGTIRRPASAKIGSTSKGLPNTLSVTSMILTSLAAVRIVSPLIPDPRRYSALTAC